MSENDYTRLRAERATLAQRGEPWSNAGCVCVLAAVLVVLVYGVMLGLDARQPGIFRGWHWWYWLVMVAALVAAAWFAFTRYSTRALDARLTLMEEVCVADHLGPYQSGNHVAIEGYALPHGSHLRTTLDLTNGQYCQVDCRHPLRHDSPHQGAITLEQAVRAVPGQLAPAALQQAREWAAQLPAAGSEVIKGENFIKDGLPVTLIRVQDGQQYDVRCNYAALSDRQQDLPAAKLIALLLRSPTDDARLAGMATCDDAGKITLYE